MTVPMEQKRPVVCVFCGSKPGANPAYLAAARALAHVFHKENITLVYGGGTAGIMGELARTLVSLSGPESVQGVIPSALVGVENGYKADSAARSQRDGSSEAIGKAPERIVPQSSSLEKINSEYGVTTIVPDMHTRKQEMAKKVIAGGPGSGFVVLPGGFGTLEEAMEMITWNQLGIHHRGIVLLNIDGYWDGIMSWISKSVQAEFVSEANSKIIVECKDAEHVLDALMKYKLSEGRYRLEWEGTREDCKP
ncbi:hypothetical protein D8B26_000678 [Coccidioides posadasii str. Silveira]|uniref:Uncharacterized protein n=1 Tax=Coccidioides posadasii (strain RMSCC 757 / Silveira) TaxID=443226 RepID=E9D8J9_COCPS|nr:conserved hypothetical protein [Coccidioides posadasii str. Silveira]QVM05969.1 hypothetical protein D8B26_000678 [Coccidioides posadasii str. Silveira]